jgi:hypothetical protein
MTWHRVDDGFPDHPKVEKLEQMGHRVWSDALSLWLVAGCYCSKVGSGGVISRAKIRRLVPRNRTLNRTIKALCDVGLWHEEEHGNGLVYRFHDWGDCNPTAEEVAETKRKNAERQRKHRQKRSRERNALRQRDVTPASRGRVTRPDPTRPDPDPPPTAGEVAPTREDHPPPKVLIGRATNERGLCRRCKKPNDRYAGTDRKLCSACHAEGKRARPEHPSERTYTGDLLSPEAEQIHELLLEHKLPLNSPVGTANRIAGKLDMGGNNKLTVARVAMAIEAVAEKAADAAADGEPRTAEEVRDHLKMWLRYSDRRWKELEDKQAEERVAATAEESPPVRYFRPERTTPEEDKAQAEANAMSIKGVLAAIKGAGPKQTAGSDIES